MANETQQQLFRMLNERWKCEAAPAPIEFVSPKGMDGEFYNTEEPQCDYHA
jgi:hypothetical protein